MANEPNVKLNEKGQCPYCGRKPIVYKRLPHFFCPRCDREYSYPEGCMVENWAWTAGNVCKKVVHPRLKER